MIFGMPALIELPNLEETLQLGSELGLDFVELNMNFPQYQIEQLENVDYLLRLKETYGLFYTIHLDENLNISDFNKAVANAYLETVRRTIIVAKAIGAPVVNMHMNHGIHITLPDRKIQLFEQYKEEYMNSMKQFRKMCEEAIGSADIKVCIENTDGYGSYEIEAIEYLLESSVFALTWDIGHSNACDNVDEDFLMKHEDRLSHFHIHDGCKKQVHMTLGAGEIDLSGRFAIAEKHHCRCVIETKTVESLKKSVEWVEENLK